MTRLFGDKRGAVFVETLIAVLVPVFFFFATWQMTDFLTAQLIVKHAALAAARAAIVVGADDPRFYDGQALNELTQGPRLEDVKSAAALVLAASPHFIAGGFKVAVSGAKPGAMLTATVDADYPCFSGWLNMVCGGKSSRTLTGKATLPYQGARFPYDG